MAGKTYTIFPKKIVYVLYFGVFELGSLVCALAPSSNALIAGRAVAGFGASGVFAGGLIILTTIIPLHKRAIWTGTYSSTFAIASIIGPVLGGALAQHLSWRWCFYLNLPIGGFALAIFFVFFHVKPAATETGTVMEKVKGLDFAGFIWFASSITMLLLALQFGADRTSYGWGSSEVIGLFVGAGIVFLVFVGWCYYHGDNALIPPRLFDNRNVWLICGGSFFVNGPFQTVPYWLAIWFQSVLAVSPTGSGIRYFPTVVADVLASFIGAGIVMQMGIWNPLLLFANASVCIGGGLLTTLYPGISQAKWIGYQIFGGMGYSLASNIVSHYEDALRSAINKTQAHLGMQASLPKDLVPMGATNLLMVISTSCAIFLSIGQTVFEERLQSNLAGVLSPTTIDGIIDGGAMSIRQVVSDVKLPKVLSAYSDSVTEVFWIPAIAPVLSFLLVAFCKWTSLTKVGDTKDAIKTKRDGESSDKQVEP